MAQLFERRFELSPIAARDLEQILLRTQTQWGVEQRLRYEARIDEAFRLIVAYPEIGRTRSDVSSGIRSFPVGRHIIFYRESDSELTVLRVLHAMQDHRDQISAVD